MHSARDLRELARSRAPADRERLMLAIADLCGKTRPSPNDPVIQELLGSIFMSLVADAEHDIRLALAERLSHAEWPPESLVNLLARDEIEIARPVIATSPVLKDADLVRILVEATVEHQIEVARRPAISAPVVESILSQAEPAVLTALASNDTAEVSPEAMGALVEASQHITGMRSPLVRHPRLTGDLAERLYLWVGQSLRSAIVTRFRVDPAALDKALAEAVGEAHAHPGAIKVDGWKPLVIDDQDEVDMRLIAKLHAAGQLKSSYLLRSLREQRMSLFRAALATLGGYALKDVKKATELDRPEYLALACAGVGVDRSAFATLLGLVRNANAGKPGGDAQRARRAFDAFRPDQADLAAAAFRKAISEV
ncbi:DUF2336 domain-containing protein [Phenylobacterium montanum]